MSVEQLFLDIISKKKKGGLASLARFILLLFSYGYSLATSCRNWAYDRQWFKSKRIPGSVIISVGNIVAGGTGKTPVIQMLATEFSKRYPTAVLSRGYRSRAEKLKHPVALSQGGGPLFSAEECGDEPYMISRNFPHLSVFVGKDRVKAAELATESGVQLILLDDGMQYRRLARDFNLVIMHAADPFGLGYVLPRGLLREQLSGLSRADLIILNNLESLIQFDNLQKIVATYSSAPLIATQLQVQDAVDESGKSYPLKGRKLGLFCGIVRSEPFVKLVEDQGGIIIQKAIFPDHHPYTRKEIEQFATRCLHQGAEYLICTDKDFVKVLKWQTDLPILTLKTDLKIVAGEEYWKRFIDQVNNASFG